MDLKEMNAQLGKVELYLRRLKDDITEAEEVDEDCVGEGCDGADDEDEAEEEEDDEADAGDEEA